MDWSRNVRVNVMRLREKKKWSQEELAIQLDKSRTWVTHVESGRTSTIKSKDLQKLAEVFSVRVADLLAETLKEESEMAEIKIEEGIDRTYWLLAEDESGYFLGEEIDQCLKKDTPLFKQVALDNQAKMQWNEQLACYEFVFHQQEHAQKTKEMLEPYLK